MQVYFLRILEVRGLKWVNRAASFLEAIEENPFPCLFLLLETLSAFLGSWPLPPSSKPSP